MRNSDLLPSLVVLASFAISGCSTVPSSEPSARANAPEVNRKIATYGESSELSCNQTKYSSHAKKDVAVVSVCFGNNNAIVVYGPPGNWVNNRGNSYYFYRIGPGSSQTRIVLKPLALRGDEVYGGLPAQSGPRKVEIDIDGGAYILNEPFLKVLDAQTAILTFLTSPLEGDDDVEPFTVSFKGPSMGLVTPAFLK